MTSMERVLTTLSHKEPDRAPLALLLTMHGAKELGLDIRGYFSKAENIVEGQLRLLAKYRHDCIYTFLYAPLELEAFGGEALFFDDGPPNAGQPIITDLNNIKNLSVPDVQTQPCLLKTLTATALLKEKVGDETPLVGVVMSPFSLPVMQLGFEKYLTLLHEQKDLFTLLMRVNQEFCVAWANAQLKAGATAICYFDPLSSPTMLPKELGDLGRSIAKETFARIHGATLTHFASGRCLPVVAETIALGTAAICVSALEDLAEVKAACAGKVAVIGNLNGI